MHRRFVLYRHEDVSGQSGTGVVAYGCEWPDKSAEVKWLAKGKPSSTASWPAPNAIEDIISTHGHGGRTEVRWLDGPDADATYGDPYLSPAQTNPTAR